MIDNINVHQHIYITTENDILHTIHVLLMMFIYIGLKYNYISR